MGVPGTDPTWVFRGSEGRSVTADPPSEPARSGPYLVRGGGLSRRDPDPFWKRGGNRVWNSLFFLLLSNLGAPPLPGTGTVFKNETVSVCRSQ